MKKRRWESRSKERNHKNVREKSELESKSNEHDHYKNKEKNRCTV